jgi:starch synthase (maltosyl-transferring)
LLELMQRHADRRLATDYAHILPLWVDRARARFGAWYEMFPRSWGPSESRGGTLHEAAHHLRNVAALGFDVVYLPPIHPIGTSFRKGRNNALIAAPDDPGSPWAIGSPAGGHKAVEPGLGSLADFDAFVDEARRHDLEVALDLAYQCSPDHPYVQSHPEWFRRRSDGTIKYAENPPKKYQDIYPFDFECEDWRGLWEELRSVVSFWIAHGVQIFRVDNPHTKPYAFWEWLIAETRREHPNTIFLSEAFTRPKVMGYLAKLGFTQSYTYFTWRNTQEELQEYFTELTTTPVCEYLRPNLFTNTPDILHKYLQEGGPAAFRIRLILAATLGASYGIYSGFELCEGRAVPGTEEYLDSEKYQVRRWDWDRPGHIKALVARVNGIRRDHPALQFDHGLLFHDTDNPDLIAYTKRSADGDDCLLVVVNLDPHRMQHGFIDVASDDFGLADEPFRVTDLLTGAAFDWSGEHHYIRLDPQLPAHIFRLVA